MILPRLLLIDDQCGWDGRLRASLCGLFGLADVTGDERTCSPVERPVAEVVVCPGQVRSGDEVLNSLRACEAAVAAGWPEWAMVLLDLRFISGRLRGPQRTPEGQLGDSRFGLAILDRLTQSHPSLPVVILSAMDRQEYIDEVLSRSARDFLSVDGYDPGNPELSPRQVLQDRLRKHGLLEDDRGVIVGRSVALRQALAAARRAGSSSSSLVLGDTGTGKELFARYIHDKSRHCQGAYVTHHLQSAESLVESDINGYERGAFTGAVAAMPGLFEQADEGTLLLDEFSEISAEIQAKLLRVLQERTVKRLGSRTEKRIDVHVIFATQRDIEEMVRRERFRYDLWERISAVQVWLPPLRQRPEDIPLLAEAIVASICRERGFQAREIARDALVLLAGHSWPGNVRELRNAIEKALVDFPDVERLVPAHLKLREMPAAAATGRDTATNAAPPPATPVVDAAPKAPAGPGADRMLTTWEELRGRLPEVEAERLEALCAYVEPCLELTRHADGSVNLSAAVKLMTGRKDLPASAAASLIKRLYEAPEDVLAPVLDRHPKVRKAWEAALRLRPGRLPKL
jgi:two-component system response regulator FlrC